MIVLDSSAVLAILLEEEEAASFRSRIGDAGGAMVSTGTAAELLAVATAVLIIAMNAPAAPRVTATGPPHRYGPK